MISNKNARIFLYAKQVASIAQSPSSSKNREDRKTGKANKSQYDNYTLPSSLQKGMIDT